MDRHRHVELVAEPNGGEKMRVEGMDTAVADECEQVQGPSGLLKGAAQINERWKPEKLSGLDGLSNSHHVLGHDPACPEVQVSDFAVAYLTLGQADRLPRRVEEGARRALPETMPGGGVTQLNSVAFTARTEAPAVEDDEADRGALPTPLRHIGGVQCSQVIRALPVVVCVVAFALPAGALRAQTRFRVTGAREWLYQQPEGKRLAQVVAGTELAGGEARGDWQAVMLDGWIFAPSVGATTRPGGDLAVTQAPEENLRDVPSGTLIARLPQGFLLSKVGDDRRWVHVQRLGWMKRTSIEPVAAVARERTAARDTGPATPESRAGAPAPATDSGPADAARAQSARRTTLYRAPEGPEAGTVGQSTPLRVVSRSGEWTRVQVEAWVKTADLATDGPGVLSGVTAAEVRTDPNATWGSR